MARIRFLFDQIFEIDGPGLGPRFVKGYVLDETGVAEVLGRTSVPEGYAEGFLNRWLQRGVAERVGDDIATGAPAVDAPADDDRTESLERMTRAELDALAAARGVDISDARNKGDVIAALQVAAE